MAWTDDWTATDYVIQGSDYESLRNAFYERVRALGPDIALAAWNGSTWYGLELGASKPNGLFPSPTPPPADPPKIPPDPAVAPFVDPIDLQNPNLYAAMQEWLSAFLAGGQGFPTATHPQPAVVAKNATLDGKQMDFGGVPPNGFQEVNPKGWLVQADTLIPTVGVVVLVEVNDLRKDAGFNDYSGKADYVLYAYAFRRRCPRTIIDPQVAPLGTPYTVDPTDTEGNTVPNNALAWERVTFTDSFGAVTHPDTGRLLRYDATAKIWNFNGQPNGEMPDLLDTEKARPSYALMGKHKPGDYIDGILLNEIKQMLKCVYRFTMQMKLTNTEYKQILHDGSDFGNPPWTDWPTTKADAVADFNASSYFSGLGYWVGKSFRAIGVDDGGTPHYTIELYGGRGQFTGYIDNNRTRRVDIYLVTGDEKIDDDYTVDVFELTGTLVYGKAKLFQTLANPPLNFSSDLLPNADPPAGPTTPPPTEDPSVAAFHQRAYSVPTAFFVADFSVAGGFQYL